MKKYLLIILLLICSISSNAQLFNYNFQSLNRCGERKAKKHFIWKTGNDIWDKFSNRKQSQKLLFLPILAFEISPKATNINSLIDLDKYLILYKKQKLGGYITLKNEIFEGAKMFESEIIFPENKLVSGYDTTKTRLKNDVNSFEINGLDILKKHKYDMVFMVKYFRNTFWFVENKKVYVIDIKESKVYLPEDYIKIKCDINIIKQMAKGDVRFCD